MNTNDLLNRYKKLHAGEGTYFYRGQKYTASDILWDGGCYVAKIDKLLRRVVSKRSSFRVLDYGCGKANYVDLVHQVYVGRVQEWYCYDPGYSPYSRPPVGQFDIVICADVMEHVLDYDETLAKIASHLERNGVAIFSISGRPDSRQFDDGLNMHVTLKTFDEWKALLSKHFGKKKAILIYNATEFWESWHATV